MTTCKAVATSPRLDEALAHGFSASDPAALTAPAGDARDASGCCGGPDEPSARGAMQRSYQRAVRVQASAEQVFARLDDQTRLGAHMGKPSAMMGGGRMTYDFDEARGQAVGSHIRMGGSAFGLSLFVDEMVVERDPPRRKAWRTVGAPRLIVVGAYEMGFEIEPDGSGSHLRVWIRYGLAPGLLGRWLGPLLAPFYARWCVGRMAGDAARHFAVMASAQRAPPVTGRTAR